MAGASANVETHVLPASVVYTEEYGRTRASEGLHHRRINHSEKVYVSGDVHTQTIEGFWSLVKNGIRGAHHAVSAKHLQGYLNEYAWRYNFRDDDSECSGRYFSVGVSESVNPALVSQARRAARSSSVS